MSTKKNNSANYFDDNTRLIFDGKQSSRDYARERNRQRNMRKNNMLRVRRGRK